MQTIPYSNAHPDVRVMDLFEPAGAKNGACILWIHGGGWRAGTRAGWHGPAQHFAARGWFCAAMDYRLAPAWRHPGQIEDVRLAMAFLRARAGTFGFDGVRIAAAGSSAGGHLAALVATLGPDDALGLTSEMPVADSRPNAAVCYCPATSLYGADDPAGKLSPAIGDLMGMTAAEDPEAYRAASPVDRVTGAEPPFLFLHGDADVTVPLAHSSTMHARLTAAGVPAELVVLDGVGHGFGYGVKTPPQKAALKHMARFLARHFSVPE